MISVSQMVRLAEIRMRKVETMFWQDKSFVLDAIFRTDALDVISFLRENYPNYTFEMDVSSGSCIYNIHCERR